MVIMPEVISGSIVNNTFESFSVSLWHPNRPAASGRYADFQRAAPPRKLSNTRRKDLCQSCLWKFMEAMSASNHHATMLDGCRKRRKQMRSGGSQVGVLLFMPHLILKYIRHCIRTPCNKPVFVRIILMKLEAGDIQQTCCSNSSHHDQLVTYPYCSPMEYSQGTRGRSTSSRLTLHLLQSRFRSRRPES